jgi:hypothetical protein
MDFPSDDDGDALRKLHEKGIDLTQPRLIEFTCWATDRASAEQIAARLETLGYACDVFEDDDTVSVYAGRQMVPSYDALVTAQRDLDAVLREYGTHCDGWGTVVD